MAKWANRALLKPCPKRALWNEQSQLFCVKGFQCTQEGEGFQADKRQQGQQPWGWWYLGLQHKLRPLGAKGQHCESKCHPTSGSLLKGRTEQARRPDFLVMVKAVPCCPCSQRCYALRTMGQRQIRAISTSSAAASSWLPKSPACSKITGAS